MYYTVDRLITTRRHMASVQMQINAAYRSLVNQIINGDLEPEEINFVRNNLWLDVHNNELCYLLSKLDKALENMLCTTFSDEEAIHS